MKRPRVLVVGLFHETPTFLPDETTLADCEIHQGDALEVAREMKWDVVPARGIRAMPSAIRSDEIVEFWWQNVEAALQTELDAVFLVLHGAMVSRSLDDVEGEILRRVRTVVGPQIPIGGVTDLHANFSLAMAHNSDCLVTYRCIRTPTRAKARGPAHCCWIS